MKTGIEGNIRKGMPIMISAGLASWAIVFYFGWKLFG